MSMYGYCDIHAHLADERLRGATEAILADCRRQGVGAILANAARPCEWQAIVALTRNDLVYGALGVHPFFADTWHPGTACRLRDLCRETPRVRAIGEIGLDFLAGREDEARQREVFTRQLVCAVELRLPVILHNRRSWSAFLAIWRDLARDRISGVCHHFSGSTEIARQALDAGLYLSFCGPLTYGNARRLKAAARYVPMDRLLTETDAPDLPPERWRGGLSVPWHVQDVVVEVARLKAIPEPEVIEQVAANFRRVLGLREEAPRAPAWGCEVPCPAAADLPREHPCRCQGQKQIGRCVANAPATVESQDQGLDDGTQPPGLDG